MSNPTVTTFAEFLAFKSEHNVPGGVDHDNQVVELPSKGAPLPGNLYVKWEKNLPFLQMIHFMIEQVPADRVQEIETAIVMLNNALPLGGYGLDHARNRLYCRFTVPAFPGEGISVAAFNRLGQACVANARDFLPIFEQIVGGAPGNTVVALVQELERQKLAARSGTPPA